jgi:hypothetical protein
MLNIFKRDGSIEFAQRICEPIGLGLRRKAWNCFSAGCDFASLPRHLGARGIVVSAYVFGCIFSALRRHFSARHRLYYDSQYGVQLGPLHEELSLTDWVFAIKCISHSCSSGSLGHHKLRGRDQPIRCSYQHCCFAELEDRLGCKGQCVRAEAPVMGRGENCIAGRPHGVLAGS